jgi:hypothetical protein
MGMNSGLYIERLLSDYLYFFTLLCFVKTYGFSAVREILPDNPQIYTKNKYSAGLPLAQLLALH